MKIEPDFGCQVIDTFPIINLLVPEQKGEMVFLHIFRTDSLIIPMYNSALLAHGMFSSRIWTVVPI